MSNDKVVRKLNNIVRNLNKIQEKTSNILGTPGEINKSQEKMLGKLKIEKLEWKAKYFETVRDNQLPDNKIAIESLNKIINKNKDKKCRLSYLLEVKSGKI